MKLNANRGRLGSCWQCPLAPHAHLRPPPQASVPLLHYASLCLDSTPTLKHVACHTKPGIYGDFFCFVFSLSLSISPHQDYFSTFERHDFARDAAGIFFRSSCQLNIKSLRTHTHTHRNNRRVQPAHALDERCILSADCGVKKGTSLFADCRM